MPPSATMGWRNEAKRGAVVFGQVVGVHIDDDIIKHGRIDMLAFKPVRRHQ